MIYFKEDLIVERVLNKVHQRAVKGLIKFGVPMTRPDFTTIKWLEEAQEEALDLAVYLERLIDDLRVSTLPKNPPPCS